MGQHISKVLCEPTVLNHEKMTFGGLVEYICEAWTEHIVWTPLSPLEFNQYFMFMVYRV